MTLDQGEHHVVWGSDHACQMIQPTVKTARAWDKFVSEMRNVVIELFSKKELLQQFRQSQPERERTPHPPSFVGHSLRREMLPLALKFQISLG